MKTQVFKGRKLTEAGVVKNILSVYNRADKNYHNDWYMEANKFALQLAVKYAVPLSVSAGVIAALSPIKTWSENKWIAELFLKTGKAKHTNLFRDKAKSILQAGDDAEQIADILRGRKITSFFQNILNPQTSTAVTIDRHALSVALGYSVTEELYRGMTKKQYEFFECAYKIAGIKINTNPMLLQSITWQQWRKEKNITETEIVVPF